ncbi:hypothetical protein [Colwellia sp. TT2012]|uniref:hypothetical protein n=1 Tax=Colwellia sp. TT2012 TaxID=1720342 RepID=UPI00070BB7A9|nr:hypothetical protein [Colwellia sp. TT2012]
MHNLSKIIITLCLLAITMTSVYAKPNPLFTLENLERERAVFLNNLTTTKLTAYQRDQQGNHIIKRLIDMERMVLRDDRISLSNSVMAKKAFQNYELTFLVHASSESKKAPMAHWLHALNITDEKIYKSQSGAR